MRILILKQEQIMIKKEGWEIKKFDTCIEKVSYPNKIKSTYYLEKGIYPIVSQDEDLISGYWNEKADVLNLNKNVVVFGDHTRILKYIDFNFVLGADGVRVLLPKDSLNAKFLYYFLKWVNVPSLGYSRHYKLLKELFIPIPPLPIQHQIVAELDTLSNIITKKKQQLTELDNLAQATFFDMFGDPVSNEKGWETDSILNVAPVKAYKGEIKPIDGKYWLLNLDIIESNSGEILAVNMVTKEDVGNSTVVFNEENVLYSKLRPYLNKVVNPKCSGYATSELLPLLPKKEVLNKVFLTQLLRSRFFVNYIQEKVAGAKMPRVSMDIFRAFKVILPPLSLQFQYSIKIESIEHQKSLISQSIAEAQQLFDYTMDKYFNEA